MASKKTTTKSTDNKYKEIFDSCPFYVHSEFEQENFNNLNGSTYSRSVIEIINKIRKIDSDLELETRTFEKQCLEEEKSKLLNVLEQQDPVTLADSINNWQDSEEDYWVNLLGKQAAIELLTFGRPTVETMSKMVKLPEELYIKSTQICVKLANAIKSATTSAEEEIGVSNPVSQNTTAPSEPQSTKKILLKKIK
jgi:hypothetical protein